MTLCDFLAPESSTTTNILPVCPRQQPTKRFAKFGAYLKSLREASGKTWGQVKIALDIDDGTLSRDERGMTDIPPARLRKYAELYKMPPDQVVREWVKVRHGVDFNAPSGPVAESIEPYQATAEQISPRIQRSEERSPEHDQYHRMLQAIR